MGRKRRSGAESGGRLGGGAADEPRTRSRGRRRPSPCRGVAPPPPPPPLARERAVWRSPIGPGRGYVDRADAGGVGVPGGGRVCSCVAQTRPGQRGWTQTERRQSARCGRAGGQAGGGGAARPERAARPGPARPDVTRLGSAWGDRVRRLASIHAVFENSTKLVACISKGF